MYTNGRKNQESIIIDPFAPCLSCLFLECIHSILNARDHWSNSYLQEFGHQYKDFYLKFLQKFSSENPWEFSNEPRIFAVMPMMLHGHWLYP
ncbi:hypothetical protein VNO77_28194 [Canavalia gladiata]|uniref:Uncharacterized protein n=1 Tax=Canavalia gladiata TaxID=3824 RepID=A0AAN9KVC6_CANGL